MGSENALDAHYTVFTTLRGDEMLCFCTNDADAVPHKAVFLRKKTNRRESLRWISGLSLTRKSNDVGVLMRCAEDDTLRAKSETLLSIPNPKMGTAATNCDSRELRQ